MILLSVDSIDRIENLIMTINHLHKHFKTNIHVLEIHTLDSKIIPRLLPKTVNYEFIEDFDFVLHRTRYLNRMIRKCSTPYIAVWDADIIISVDQIVSAIELLRSHKAHFVYPYEGLFLDVTKPIRNLYFKTQDIQILKEFESWMIPMYLPIPVGGAFIVKAKSYEECGLENEAFYGWGREDGERITRWQQLGFSSQRIKGVLYHLSHARGINSSFHTRRESDRKAEMIKEISVMSEKELRMEISRWHTNE